MFDRRLFDLARDSISVEDLAGRETDLVKAGSERRGQCPLCGAGKKSASAQFCVKPMKQVWRCYGCDRFGDVVDLERELRGRSPVEAARRLTGDLPLPERTNRPIAKPKAPEGPSASDKVAIETWREVRPFAGSPAETYLLARGIAPEVLTVVAPRLFWHPNAKWGWDEGAGRWIKAPALVVQVVVRGPGGGPVPTGGVHCTYLAKGGKAKAALDPAKRMWGPQHLDGRFGGALLFEPTSLDGDLAAGEGLESVLSVLTLHYRRTGVVLGAVAALSLDRLQGGLLRDNDGCIDPYEPKPNPERPAFVWAGARRLALIAVDRDMKRIKVKARTPRGRVCDFWLESEARARLCARFASAAWKAAGAREARAIAPSPGCDFNDELRRVLAAEARRA